MYIICCKYIHTQAPADRREWAAKVWDSEKLIVTKGRHDVRHVVHGGVLLCNFVFVLLHARISRTRVCQCVWNMRWRARRAYIASDIAH